jgi:DNA-binding winged helix-turn-helix (wHTH) protein/tetratricopeptide (TPR) repeat protein
MALVANNAYCFENIEISASQRRLFRDGDEKHLRRQAFEVLLYLIQQHERAVGREELIQTVWHGSAVTDDSLGQCISEIREVLGDSSRNPRYIKTLPKVGYQFIGPVRGPVELAVSAVPNSEEAVHPADGDAGSQAQGTQSERRTWERWRFPAVAVLGVAAALVTILIVFATRQHGVPASEKGDATPNFVSPRRSIAVLGFTNLSGRPEDDWLSTAFSDWLSTDLAAGEQLRTVLPDTVAAKKPELQLPRSGFPRAADLPRIGQQLGADLLLAGAYAKLGGDSGGLIRLDLRLQDTRTGETLAAISETGSESRLFDLVSQAGATLRSKLAVPEVTRDEAKQVAAALPSDPAAARLYAEGVEKLRASDFREARDVLERAVAAAPTEPMPHAALAAAWEQLGYDGKAQAEAHRAFDLSSHLSRADRLLIEARFQEASRDWDKAIHTYTTLFDFFPDDLDIGLSLANAQVVGGKWHDALQTIAVLRRLPAPLRDDPRIDWQESRAARSLGDMPRAVASAARSADKARAAGATSLQAQALLEEARSLEPLRELNRITALVQNARQLFTSTQDQQGLASATNYLATVWQGQGDDQSARKGYEEALAIDQRIEYQPGIAAINNNLGGIELDLGNPARALQRYQEAVATYRRIGELDGVALAQQGLGDVYLAMGELKLAKSSYQESLDICRQNGDRSRAADALAGLGQLSWVEGDLNSALDTIRQVKTSYEQLGERSRSLHLEAQMASILLDQGKSAEAVNVARAAIAASPSYQSRPDQTEIHVALAKALLAQHKVNDALAAFEVARQSTADIHNKELEWSVAITSAELGAASGQQGVVHAEKQLNDIVRDATAMSYVGTAFTARLKLGSIELHSANPSSGRAVLAALRRDAELRGFGLTAKQCSSAQ